MDGQGRRALGTGMILVGWLMIALAVATVLISLLGVLDGRWRPGERAANSAADDEPAPEADRAPAIRPLPQEPTPAQRWMPLLLAASVALPLIAGGIALTTMGRRLLRG